MQIGPQRPVNPDAIVVPQGYRVEALITGLSFPSAISFGPGGELYLAERGGIAGLTVTPPRVLRIDPDRSVNEIGRLDNPIVGLVYRNGGLFIAEDGPEPRILQVTAEGEVKVLVQGLPGGGDYGLSGLALDAQGGLIFGLGTRTNSGVVGLDNVARGWVAFNPNRADVLGADVELAGVNYVTSQPGSAFGARQVTGGLKPFGQRAEAGEKLKGENWCGGAVYRLSPEAVERGAGDPDRLAWGFRNPMGIVCTPDGRIFATEGGMEERGSRPVANAPDNLWEVQPNGYYGWPDHVSGVPITEARFRLPGHSPHRALLSRAPRVSGTPVVTFPCRSGVAQGDLSYAEAFGFAGDMLVALAGEWYPPAYPADETELNGHRVVRVDLRNGAVSDFLANRDAVPSSRSGSGGLERPYDVRFDPTGEVLYVVDLGEVHATREAGVRAFAGTGVVWRVTKIRPMVQVPAAVKGRREAPPVEVAEETQEAPAVAEERAPEVFEAPEVAPAEEAAEAPVTAPEPEAAEAAEVAPEAEALAAPSEPEEAPAEGPVVTEGVEEPEVAAEEGETGAEAPTAEEAPETPEVPEPVSEEAPSDTVAPAADETPEEAGTAPDEESIPTAEPAEVAEANEPEPAAEVEPEGEAAAEEAASAPETPAEVRAGSEVEDEAEAADTATPAATDSETGTDTGREVE